MRMSGSQQKKIWKTEKMNSFSVFSTIGTTNYDDLIEMREAKLK